MGFPIVNGPSSRQATNLGHDEEALSFGGRLNVHWIKISTAIFDDEKIKLIDALPDRDAVFTIWVKLLVLAGRINDSGKITMDEAMPYTDEMLATVFNRPVNTIRLALDTFRRFHMLETLQGDVLFITNWEKHQNLDGMDKIREDTRLRNIKYREKKKLQVCDARVTRHDATESESESESESEKERDKSKTPKTKYAENVNFTESEYDKFVSQLGSEVVQQCIEKLDAYKLANGKRYKSDAGAMRSWVIRQVLKDNLELTKAGPRETAEEKRLRLCREEMAKI